jgi:hypothetical protein
MPRTTSGLKYRVAQRDDSAFCIVCGTDDGHPTVEVLMQIPRLGDHKTYGFPVCSLVCCLAWTELLSRVDEGEQEAMAVAIAYMAQHEAS